MRFHRVLFPVAIAYGLTGCGDVATLPEAAGFGATPQLPAPHKSLLPTINIAPAKGWSAGTKPLAAPGTTVSALASGLDHPRWLYVLPNGDVLVAETNAPPKPEDSQGIKGWIMKMVMKRAGAGTPSANRITLLGNDFYVADSDAVLRFPYVSGQTTISAPATKLVDLPAGLRNHHWTKNIIANADGSKLYATVGSNSNVAENGMAAEEGRAAIWEIDAKTGSHRIFASGLRNPNGMAWETSSNTLWAVANERDEIGSDLVPDYLTSVRDGAFYGWPYSYYGQHVDLRVTPQRPDLVEKAIAPDFALGAHTASLGLVSAQGTSLPGPFASGMFVGQHGSWNRNPHSGYKVIFVPFSGGKPSGQPIDVLTGFLSPSGDALGRPVGVALDKSGALLVADDVGNVVWRVSAAAASGAVVKP